MTDNVSTITAGSYRFGLHHGPQYNVVVGEGLYEFGTGYPAAENHITDKTSDACVTCHMNVAYGTQAGGHTFNVAYDYHGSTVPNLPASCEECHIPDGGMDLGDKMDALQTDITALLTELGTALETAGVKEVGANYIVHTSNPTVIAPQTELMLAAFTNFQAITEDRSLGMHNPAYIRVLLANTISAVNAAK